MQLSKIGLFFFYMPIYYLDSPRVSVNAVCKCRMTYSVCQVKILVLTVLSPFIKMLIWKEPIIDSTVLDISLVSITLKSLMNSVCLTSVCRSQQAKQWAFVLVLTKVISSRALKLEVKKLQTYLNFVPIVKDSHSNS